jgi:1,4-dihydroxy-2-naphthoate octaprenyltransferase
MIKAWIDALRLKTLPLALGAIIIGSSHQVLHFKVEIFLMAALTAILLQILSNLANDYGDFVKGTDNHRKDRALAGGKIRPKAMKIAIIVTTLLSLASGIYLLYLSFGTNLKHWIIFLIIGLLSIAAAILYTVGKRAYGYFGLGDLFVFLFFGLVGVSGTAFLYKGYFDSLQLFPAIAYGLMCVAVLNVNNIRDLDKDVLNNKITLASYLGREGALRYQAIILYGAVLAFLLHLFMDSYTNLAPFGLAILSFFHLKNLNDAEQVEDYNNQLRLLSLGCLGVAILFMLKLYTNA